MFRKVFAQQIMYGPPPSPVPYSSFVDKILMFVLSPITIGVVFFIGFIFILKKVFKK